MKNPMSKSRKTDDPYLVFENEERWTWKVLKSYQGDNAKPYARWFCAVSSPFTHGSFELGDVYVKEIIDHAQLMYVDDEIFATNKTVPVETARAEFMHNLNAARFREPVEFGG